MQGIPAVVAMACLHDELNSKRNCSNATINHDATNTGFNVVFN
jgi:hypothetical protein